MGFNFNKKSSKYFIITVLANTNSKIIEKIVENNHRTLRKKVRRLSGGVLHCHKEKPQTRKRLLKQLSTSNSLVMSICLNKGKVHTKLQDEKHVLYNYVTNILIDRILNKKLIPTGGETRLIVSKRETNKFLNSNFTSYLKEQARLKHNVGIEVIIKTPSEEKALQAVDFVSWSIFNKYEKDIKDYYNIIKPIIIEENMLFP